MSLANHFVEADESHSCQQLAENIALVTQPESARSFDYVTGSVSTSQSILSS